MLYLEKSLGVTDSILLQVKSEIQNEDNSYIQKIMNDVLALTLLRILQFVDLTSSECDALFGFIEQMPLSDEVVKIYADKSIVSKKMIINRFQIFLDTICHEMMNDNIESIIKRANNYDIRNLEKLLIKGIIDKHIKPIETDKVFSRFLWIAYSRISNIDYESIINRNTYISFEDFGAMIKCFDVITPEDYKWRGDVIDAALLAKSRVEKELQIENSLDFNHRPISGRTIDFIKNHETISNACIVKQLQTAMDKLCIRKIDNRISQYRIRSREMKWFLALFEGIQGEAYLQIPTKNTLWGFFEDMFVRKIKNETIADNEIIDEELLCSKRLVCHDNKIVAIEAKRSIPIFVAHGSVSCQRKNHVIINVEAIVKTVKNNVEVRLPIQKCIFCKPNRYFISNTVLNEYEKNNGIMYFRRINDFDANVLGDEYNISQKMESVLFEMGYNVNAKTGLSDLERQRILIRIIKTGKVTKAQAMRHIDGLIRRHQDNPNYTYALPKWKRDLHYLAKLKDADLLYKGYLYR